PARPDAVGAVPVLEARQYTPLDDGHVGEAAEQDDAQDQRLEERDEQRVAHVVGHDATASRSLSTTRVERSACARPCGWSGVAATVIRPGGTASVTRTVARRHRPSTRRRTSSPLARPRADASSGFTLSGGPPRSARRCGFM